MMTFHVAMVLIFSYIYLFICRFMKTIKVNLKASERETA